MNRRMILYIVALALTVEAGFMLFPALVGLIYREKAAVWFFIVALMEAILCLPFVKDRPEDRRFAVKEGCIATALCWIGMSAVGALPFYLSKTIPSYIDALFEMVSGFTTTGASIVASVEKLPYCVNFWRCLSHWIGGMGILVFLMMVVQMADASNINLLRAESPGPSVGKITPKMRQTARLLYIIYIALSVLQFILLLLGKMPVFDALCTTFGTAGTGGFGIKNDSFASYSPYLQWVTAIFMILFGINFNAYAFLLFKRFKQAFTMEEVRYYVIVIAAAVLLITIDVSNYFHSFGETLRHAVFQVGSIITTTGFATEDFNVWPGSSRLILVMLMFIGACAGSTGGGIKVSRFAISIKAVGKELKTYLHPKRVHKIQMDGVPVERDVIRGINVYLFTFLMIFVSSVLLISLDGKDLVTTVTAVCATLNNIGPGLGVCGPAGNFASFSYFSKIVMMFDMIAGRLELFPLLMLFYPPCLKALLKKEKEQTRFKF